MGAGASSQVAERLQGATAQDLRSVLQALPSEDCGRIQQAVSASASASATAATASEEEIPSTWGWPKEPFDPEALRLHVLEATKPTQQEAWDDALAARSMDGKKEDFVEEKAFANLLLNKEGTGEQRKDRGIDHHAYEKGKWYRFLNFKGDCYVPCLMFDASSIYVTHWLASRVVKSFHVSCHVPPLIARQQLCKTD